MFGGCAYVLLELAYRKRSHVSMFLAGGTCFLFIHKICNGTVKLCNIFTKCIAGSCIVTAVELFYGTIFNRCHNVWDYSSVPFNFKGQICLPFSLIWAGITFPAMKLGEMLDKGLDKIEK